MSGLSSRQHMLHDAKRNEMTHRAELIEAMQLRFDPFSSSVSESYPEDHFTDVYVAPPISLLQKLQQPEGTFIFGDHGSGKTATRLVFEHALRTAYSPEPTLCVTSVGLAHPLKAVSSMAMLPWAEQAHKEYLDAISRDFSIDLVIQTIERLGERFAHANQQPDAMSIAALRRHLARIPPRLLQGLIHAARDQDDDRYSTRNLWHGVRSPLRYVARTRQWRQLLSQAVDGVVSTHAPIDWQQLVDDARLLGFPQTFILIDAIDESHIEPQRLAQAMTPLLMAMAELAQIGVFLKWFLPSSLRLYLDPSIQALRSSLTHHFDIATMSKSDGPHLKAILHQRLHVASASSTSVHNLDWFVGEEINGSVDSIEDYLVEHAHGSPRRLLDLASFLIDFHSTYGFRDGERLSMNADEWHRFTTRVAQLG